MLTQRDRRRVFRRDRYTCYYCGVAFPEGDEKYVQSRRTEIVKKGRDINLRRLFREVDRVREGEKLQAIERFLEERATERLMKMLEAIRPK